MFLNLQPVSAQLIFTGFDVPFSAAAGTPVSVEVWARTGTYVGFTASNTDWTMTQTIGGVSQGPMTSVPLVLTTPIALPATSITAIYLHAVLPAMGSSGIRYTGTGALPPQTTWSNTDLVLFSDTTRTGFVAFGGTAFTPRTFSGTLRYAPIDSGFADGFE